VDFVAQDLTPIVVYDPDDGNVTQFQTRFGKQYIYLGTKIDLVLCQTPNSQLATTGVSIAFQRAIMVRVIVLSNKRNISGTETPNKDQTMWINQKNENTPFDPDANQILSSMTYKVDPKRFNVHYDRIHTIGGGGNTFGMKHVKIWVSGGKGGTKINCNDDLAGAGGQDKRYWVFWLAYDPEIVGSGIEPAPTVPPKIYKTSMTWKTYFKDP